MLSYWDTASFLQYHYIIVGAGITGLSTAIELKEKFPSRSILVLERGILPIGASTRNAGFACMGSVTELLDDLENLEVEKVIELFEWRKMGLLKLRKRLGDTNMAYAENGSFELIAEDQKPALEKISYLNELLQKDARPVFSLANDKIGEFGFSKKHVKALVRIAGEGELHSGKMMQSLLRLAVSKGVEIKTGAGVCSYNEEKGKVLVRVKDPVAEHKVEFESQKMVICTNAFTPALIAADDVTPGRGQVLITSPIKNLPFKGIFHFEKGYYYFREIDGRVLMGGGRNLDINGETSVELKLNHVIQEVLEKKLREMVLPGTPFTIEKRWSGIMAFGPDKFPLVRKVSDNVYGAYRLGGMGIALGSKVAEKLVELMGSE